jgi:uncharacterized membrane protein
LSSATTKNLFICCDGTDNYFGLCQTNFLCLVGHSITILVSKRYALDDNEPNYWGCHEQPLRRHSVLTGVCVGVGTLFFFLLFQKGGPLSAVPMILAGGAALMAVAGILFFKESASWPRLVGIVLSIVGLFLLRS